MMAEETLYRRRVLVALDPCEVDPADLEASARLAAGLNAELVALFVEDSDVIAAADLPFARLIPAGCRNLAALDGAAMRRAFRIAEGRAREHLSNAAQRWHLDWSFEVTEVRQAGETVAQLRREDFLALASATGRRAVMTRRSATVRAEPAPCPVMLLRRDSRPDHRRGQPVAVLYEGDESTLMLGRDLARVYDSPLLVLVAGEGEADLAAREAEAGRWLAAAGAAGVAQRITARDAEGIGRLLCEVDAGLAVVDHRAAVGGGLDIEALAEQTRASIVVLGLR
ncbi:MAG: hypothetical protein R3285_00135 [Kiloniellales bacterium]|nr:hypothetical protein [Kiloniellales bacterium]